ncbi:MAG: neutral/alkaline non-lysosomal ceramidase N-terminal domain-containing protein [Planctomycetales bacterium]
MRQALLLMLLIVVPPTCGLTVHSDAVVHAADKSNDGSTWQAGVSRVVITPPEFMWMSGYGGRTGPAEGKVHDLYARATALRDAKGETVVFVATDLIGVPKVMATTVAAALEKKHGLPRSALMIACSHTHCGPAVDARLSYMLDMKEADWAQIRKYQDWLNKRVTEVVDAAIADLKPARLSTGSGVCRFASNRRTPKGIGPYDHQVPVLKIESLDGSRLRGVVFGYACHNTTLGFYEWCGDYSGFAQLYLEDRHPDSVAMFFTGGGADQNPLPRRKIELARKYGRMLAVSVDNVLDEPMKSVAGRLASSFEEVELEFDQLPTKEKLQTDLKNSSRYTRARAKLLLSEWERDGSLPATWPYPIQVWKVGDGLNWVALGGELVVDYQLRLKRELGENSTWVTGYANDVMAYIPSERVLEEGGYEGDTSMIVYQLPSKWKAGLEDQIVSTVHRLAKQNNAAAK